MLRANRGPGRWLLAAAHRGVMAAAARALTPSGGSAYVRGGFSGERPLYGVSDIDLNIVIPDGGAGSPGGREGHVPGGRDALPGARRAAIRNPWRRLSASVPTLGKLLHLFFYEHDALEEAVREPAPMYGVDDDPPGRSAYFGTVARGGAIGLLEAGLYGPLHGWRRVAGPPSLPVAPPAGPQMRMVRGWLSMQSWWRWAFAACVDPDAPWVPLMCVKLVSEPTRIWRWAGEGEMLGTRAEVLERALELLPDEEPAVRIAIELGRRLPESPEPPLAETLAFCARMSGRVAALLGDAAEAAGHDEVELLGADSAVAVADADRDLVLAAAGRQGAVLPLADWRARTLQDPPDECFALAGSDRGAEAEGSTSPGAAESGSAPSPGDPGAVAAAARAGGGGAYLGLRGGGLLVLPASDWDGGRMRAVQCGATDAVSFALIAGDSHARFPRARGWSARDCARRAAAEQAPRVFPECLPRLAPGAVMDDPAPEAARVWSAIRAGLFLDSVGRDAPALALTIRATADALAEREPATRGAAEEGAGAYLEWRRAGGAGPAPEPPRELRDAARRLLEPTP